MAEHQPTSVVDFVGRRVFVAQIVSNAWCLEVPVVQTVQKGFGYFCHGHKFSLTEMAVLVDDEMGDRFAD